jgi:hypothetical protein
MISLNKYIFAPLFVSLSITPAHADFWSDAVGFITDPLKLEAGTENVIHAIDRTAIHIERIQGEFDDDTRFYLAQIDKTISDTRESITANLDQVAQITDQVAQITNDAFVQISGLEQKLFFHTRELVKCTSEIMSKSVQDTLAEMLNDLGERKPRLVLFGKTILEAKIDPSDITNPIESFRRVKSAYDDKLADIKPTDHASKITDVYGEMQRLADLGRCHYKSDNDLFGQLYWYELEYNRLGRSWVGRVKPL